ncbi:MAG: response regulator transcription factor [Chitinophagaceae bacterium]|jgi:DNA-binding response OmpR family regulator
MKILYVEDEHFLGRIVKETLETKGFEILMEADGAKVINQYQQFNPDIVVLDVMLPNKSGFEIAKEMRDAKITTPILFLTAKTQTTDVVKGFTVGGNDYLRKPFSIEELIVRLENLHKQLGNTQTVEPQNEVLIGKFSLQLNKQVLKMGETERKLSYRETELIKFLFYNANKIIDRRDVLQHIWGNDSLFNSRNLDVYITKIRSYFKEDSNLEIITIKGVGYRFVMEG